MTRDQAIIELRELQNDDDIEIHHGTADAILCALLESMGCQDVVAEYEKVPKWYA